MEGDRTAHTGRRMSWPCTLLSYEAAADFIQVFELPYIGICNMPAVTRDAMRTIRLRCCDARDRSA